ncbi:superoxide dismutase [Brevifollis gellanilyticus]|uniref:superoxide dismutase n=1 Tax=Brevifollis gellanilyticus TaxID=748831 RepID=A0A512M4I5_9BACT|nr:superoxide dismutase [Brevifollis gellanilyticus]GEP41656.1 superoxide dismutase [Brevifollis gellanilyticus]
MSVPLMPRRAFLASALPALAGTVLGAEQETRPAPLGISLQQEPLRYELDALEPYLDAVTLKLHYHEYHAKHLAEFRRTLDDVELSVGSVTSLMPCIKSIKRPPQVRQSILQLSLANSRPATGVQSELPEDVQKSIRQHGGAHVNHTIFWRFLAPSEDTPLGPSGRASQAIDDEFGTLQEFKKAFTAAAMKHSGSGWAWLVYRPDKKLVITTTPNEDNPLMKEFVDWREHGRVILALDLWEHSYYAKYKNNRRAYIDAWWKVVNWEFVDKAHAIVRGIYNHS